MQDPFDDYDEYMGEGDNVLRDGALFFVGLLVCGLVYLWVFGG